MITVAFRPSPFTTGEKSLGKRASLVVCDFTGCDKALEFPVNLQSSDYQCKRDTIRYMFRKQPHGWRCDERGTYFYCRKHATTKGIT